MCKNMPPLELAIQFHGHICPGLLMGIRVAEFALEYLGVEPDSDEELVAIVETDSCGVDAIQSILGCTFGKGNLIFKDYGKNVYTIARRDTNRAVRIAQKFGVKFGPEWPRYRELANQKNLSGEELNEKENLIGIIFEKLMTMPFEELFTSRDVEMELPEKARIAGTVQCESCGEGVMESRTFVSEKGVLCQPCASKEGV
ncbi:MAG TPA: FmdE family protein [Syntrophomonadaceae bacterium]|nr:FmdE family protein [Syntrophomonadaceae bacterium]